MKAKTQLLKRRGYYSVNKEYDVFQLEIIKNSLLFIGDEMFETLAKTSMSPIIYEVLDYACGITDNKGNLLTQGNGVAGFIGMLSFMVKDTIKKYKNNNELKDGDIIIINDPYTGGGSHLSDVGLVMPIFHKNELIAFAANKAHWTEVGGKDPGSFSNDATEVYQEGIQFPCIKIVEEGKINHSLVNLIEANVRMPELSIGDLWAQIATLKTGANRVKDLCLKNGEKALKQSMSRLLNQGELQAKNRLRELSNGIYKMHDYIDDDGLGNGPFKVQVKVEIKEDELICDFRGSHSQVKGPVNCSYTALVTSVRIIYLSILNLGDIVNDGVFRPLKVISEQGSILSAEKPAPTSIYWESDAFGAELVWKALAPSMIDRLNAGHFLSVCSVTLEGVNPHTDEPFLIVEPSVGGWGAGKDIDGARGQFCIGDGETYNIPIEVAENRYGIMIEEYTLRNDGAGAGKYIGGTGVIRSYKALSDNQNVSITFGRSKYLPWGLDGGEDGSPNEFYVIKANGEKKGPLSMCARHPLNKGDVIQLLTGTGGGYGPPQERDKNKLKQDIKNGYIPLDRAKELYDFN